MRTYNSFLCPKCGHFEYRPDMADRKVPPRLYCHAGKREEEIILDSRHADALTNPPPRCQDFRLKGRRSK